MPEEQSLQDVWIEVHRRIAGGAVWGAELIEFVVSQQAVRREAERQARKRAWIDKSVSIADLSGDLLSVAWERLRHFKVTDINVCVRNFIVFMTQCLWHLPQSQAQRRAKARTAAGKKTVVLAGEEVLETTPDRGTPQLSNEFEGQLPQLWLAACRRLQPPRNIIMSLMSSHKMSQKEVAQLCGLAESTVSGYIRESTLILVELISNWRDRKSVV